MSRACVIVLDGVGAGALPDADRFGDEGSNTLGNVARAVGGLDLPNLGGARARERGPVRRLPSAAGSAGGAGACSSARAARTRSRGTGSSWASSRRRPMPTYPHGFPFEVIDPFMHRDGQGSPRQPDRLRDRDHPGARRGAPAHRKVDRLHLRRLRLPARRARGHDPSSPSSTTRARSPASCWRASTPSAG